MLYCKFTVESASKRILNIGYHLAKLVTELFFHSVYIYKVHYAAVSCTIHVYYLLSDYCVVCAQWT